jgi:hypothetical protein
MPLRGAVTFGEMYINLSNNIYLGKALTRAYDLERRQQWIGVAIDKSLPDAFSEMFKVISDKNNILSQIFLKYDVPFKDKTNDKLHTINWRWNLVVEDGTKSLFLQKEDKNVLEKINNTLQYAKYVISTKKVYVQDQKNLPIELRSMFIGSSEPPFKHGDDF